MSISEVKTDQAYRLLGLRPGCRESQIKRAFRRLAHRFHPDKLEGPHATSEMFLRIKAARDKLRRKIREGARAERVRYPLYCWLCGRVYGTTFLKERSRRPRNECGTCWEGVIKKREEPGFWEDRTLRMIAVLVALVVVGCGVFSGLMLSGARPGGLLGAVKVEEAGDEIYFPRLTVQTIPSMQVYLGGHYLGVSPVNEHVTMPGRRKLRLVNGDIGYDRVHRIDLKVGERVVRTFRVAKGWIRVNAGEGEDVYIDGKLVGRGVVDQEVYEGIYDIEFGEEVWKVEVGAYERIVVERDNGL